MAKDDGDEALKAIGQVVLWPVGAVLGLAIMLPFVCYAAFVAQRYWGWFVAPTFGIPAPPLADAVGLVLLARLLAARAKARDDTPEEAKVKRWLAAQLFEYALAVSAFWLLGWLFHVASGWFVS